MTLNKLSVAVASSKRQEEIVCGACKNGHIAQVIVLGDQRIVCIPKQYELTADGVWRLPNRRMHPGRPKPLRKPQTSPVRVSCINCGSVQFVFPENFDAGILQITLEEARAWTP